jgi:hypothetical protein
VDEETKRRIAENEAIFREANEDVHATDTERVGAAPPETAWDFLCECGDAGCHQPVRLTVAEYERVRSNPIQFAVVPGHERPEVEQVVATTDRFAVVEKAPGEREVALETDPRS